MRLRGRIVIATAVAVATTLGSHAVTAAADVAAVALGPAPVTVVVDIEHSRFSPASIPVVAGTTVQFVVVNNDPINHELIVGPQAVHDRHSDGTEASHPLVPGEVSVPALERRLTTYTFDTPGVVKMICHLPGHAQYGMTGEVTVVPRR